MNETYNKCWRVDAKSVDPAAQDYAQDEEGEKEKSLKIIDETYVFLVLLSFFITCSFFYFTLITWINSNLDKIPTLPPK